MRHAVEEAGFAVKSAELSMVPKVTVAIDDDSTAKKVVRLVEALEDNDDVQDVYANFDIPEAVLEARPRLELRRQTSGPTNGQLVAPGCAANPAAPAGCSLG